MILRHAPTWGPIVEEYEQSLRQQHAALDELQQAYAIATQEQGRWQRLAQEREARITILEDTLWVRLGLRLGIIKQPERVSRDGNQAKNLPE